jgi:3-dehydroquinate synthase
MRGDTDILILKVALGTRSYDIAIGSGLMARFGEYIRDELGAGSVCVISDVNVWTLHGAALTASVSGRADIRSESYAIPPGEENKNITRLSAVYDWLAEGGRLTRDGLIIAFGGGVVGDLAGFAAATWMRGVRYVQIPTTLLAMVDSSVGGKTAVDIEGGKNLVGAFHQPSLVLIDPDLLGTLPDREFGAGLAEVVKYGAIASESIFRDIEYAAAVPSAVPQDVRERIRDTLRLEDVIRDCCSVKSEIVAEDEYDTGRRAILNFGHTFGHAIEARHIFGKYSHGEAVAAGMSLAAAAGEKLGVTEPGTAARMDDLLAGIGLDFREDPLSLLEYMKKDKKAVADGVNLVLLKRIGDAVVHRIAWDELERVLKDI